MRAVIMAGGEGTRLRPLTSNQPKPMIPLLNRPLMEHSVRLLKRHGFTDVVVTVQFLASLVRTYFGTGEDLGVSLSYATEETPLGTAGSVKNAEGALTEPFVVASGDALTDIDLEKAATFHRERGALATVVLSRQENPLEYGIVIADDEGRIERFLEKPGWGEVFSDTVNTGIYVLEPEIFDAIPAGEPCDFSKDVFPALLAKGAPIFGYVAEGYWADVGNTDAYLRAQQDALDRKVDLEIPGFEVADGIWVEEGAIVDPDARIEGPVLLGEHVKLEPGAHVREYTVLGKNTVVKAGAFLHRATVHDNAYIGENANLRGCVVGRNADVRRNARIEEGVVLGDEAFVGEGAVLQPNVKVYPFKVVEAGAVIQRSIIWESRGTRTLFGRRGVSGLINVDITPDVAVRLAMAYATTLARGSAVMTGRDASRAARMIKRAIIAGLNGSGVHVNDLEVAPLPVARFHVRAPRTVGGLYVSASPGDQSSLDIRFFDDTGADIDQGAQRAIERVYYREDFRRAFPDEIGELRYPPRALELYQAGLLESLDLTAIREADVKAILDCAFGPNALLLPGILGRLGGEILPVNSFVDEGRPTLSDDERARHRTQLADLVRASRARFGAFLDPTGEAIELVGEGGQVLAGETALLVLANLVLALQPGGTIVVPITAPSAVETIAERYSGRVVRCRMAPSAIAAAVVEEKAVFAGTADGRYIFADFLHSFDGLASFCRILELSARTGVSLAGEAATMPVTHLVHRLVRTPWERKGAVMRHIAGAHDGDRIQDTEGLKVFRDDEWALVIPDPEDPVTHVWAEARSARGADERADRYVALVEEAIDE